MSRSWERKVRKNSTVLNKNLKKQGGTRFVPEATRLDRFRGRNYILPVAILMFTGFYVYMSSFSAELEANSLFWVTIISYLVLAALFFFRRPYLTVAKEFVQTRKMTGDKILRASGIRRITTQPGYIMIEQVKGANWVFSRTLNRYPTDEMAVRLEKFAKENQVEFVNNK